MEETLPDTNCRNLICVLFPGIVKNDDKAIECLGGIRKISQVYTNSKTKRLALTFNPENSFAKFVHGDSQKTAGLLLKVKAKKRKVGGKIEREVISTSVIGRVNNIYKFNALMDFQYLPLHAESENQKPVCFFNDVVPSGPQPYSWLKAPAPVFIVPSSFTRSEKPLSYSYTKRRYGPRREIMEVGDKLHKLRSDRSCRAQRIAFRMDEEWPLEPNKYFLDRLKVKMDADPTVAEQYERVKQAFVDRPLWSKNRVQFETKANNHLIKVILPCVAVHVAGPSPWRLLWCRYGYDPRKEPSSRIYQVLDYRVRHSAGVNAMISKRSFTKTDRVRKKGKKNSAQPTEEPPSEKSVIFRPNALPTQRQTFYQYCDIELPEVQELISRLGEVPAGALCQPLRGWMPPAFDQQCRDLLFEHTKKTILQHYKEDIGIEDQIQLQTGPMSDEEQEPDEEQEYYDDDGGSTAEDDDKDVGVKKQLF